ncbi:LysM peptidoglycan-binding domain-containing M23 family metallopeptidase [Pasteuria penetrans]|uniref:LysM peptidoglycan-binding domain-containing M23 family metallopeptidase n=1 Tax=Pasteuria penetrans TaxID=86005 RepID=UPI000FB642BC|nr:M23 family metallopeptidase [Pasteuria penetrans]
MTSSTDKLVMHSYIGKVVLLGLFNSRIFPVKGVGPMFGKYGWTFLSLSLGIIGTSMTPAHTPSMVLAESSEEEQISIKKHKIQVIEDGTTNDMVVFSGNEGTRDSPSLMGESVPIQKKRVHRVVRRTVSHGNPGIGKKAKDFSSPWVHQIRQGDTLHGIGRLYGVSPVDIIRVNNGLLPHVLESGDSIYVPVRKRIIPFRYGDTIEKLTRDYRGTRELFSAWNPWLENPDRVSPSTLIAIPIPCPLPDRIPILSTRKGISGAKDPRSRGNDADKRRLDTHVGKGERRVPSVPMEEEEGAAFESTDVRIMNGKKKPRNDGQLYPVINERVNGERETASPRENMGEFFSWPVRGKITSGFGWRGGRMHNGIDIWHPDGRRTPIFSSRSGKVIRAEWAGTYGNLVVIDHRGEFETYYAHLDRISISKGQWVEKGDLVGWMGRTGDASGYHLHFEVLRRGRAINPRSCLRLRKEMGC